MSNTIETVTGRTLTVRRTAPAAQSKRVTATWQNGLEAGGHVQRKLRLAFATLPAHPLTN